MQSVRCRLPSRPTTAGASAAAAWETDQLKELKRLQKENERLPRVVSDLTLELILAEPARGNLSRTNNREADCG